VLAGVVAGPPTPLDELNKGAPAELVAICDKAMARDASERYANTIALAEDLRNFLEHRVVSAYETGAWAEARKWVRRNQPLAAALASAVALLLGGLSVSLVLMERAGANSKRADANARLADERALVAQASEKKAGEEAARANEQARKAHAVEDFLKDALRAADPTSDTAADYRVRDLLDRASDKLAQGFSSDPEIRGVLHGVIAHSYNGLGERTKAMKHIESGIADLETAGLHESSEMVDGLYLRGEIILGAPGTPTPEALDIAQQSLGGALEVLSRLPGEHTYLENSVRGSLSYVGTLRSGRLDRNDPWPESTVAFIAQRTGRTDLEAVRQELNEKLRRIVRAWSSGRHQEAKDIIRADYTEYLKNDALRMLASGFLTRMGYQAQLTGLFEFAEPVLELAVDFQSEVPEPNRAYLVAARGNLAYFYMTVKRWDEARKLHSEILPIAREVFGPIHESTVTLHLRQATVLRTLGVPADAVLLLRPLLEEMIAGSADEARIHAVWRDLGLSFEFDSRLEEALECYRAALSSSAPDIKPLSRFQALLGQGRCSARLGGSDEAETAFIEAWRLCSALDDPFSDRREEASRLLFDFYTNRGNFGLAHAYLREAGCE
jgi:tetratricopeptide (TPR) repeat protein